MRRLRAWAAADVGLVVNPDGVADQVESGIVRSANRTLKEEEVYWRIYENPADARACLAEFEARYNERRPHWALVPEGGGDPVTPREGDVLRLLAQGESTKGMAERLFVRKTTVRTHVQHVLAKLGAHSRLEAVARGQRMGLLRFTAKPDRRSRR